MYPDRSNRFCRACGQPTEQRLPDDGDDKVRSVCTACATVHYLNPLNVVGTIPVWTDPQTGVEKILLCRRNIEPRFDKWTLPAGFMEMGESTETGAARETIEEAGATFEMGDLFTLISVLHVGQVHFFYKARLTSDKFNPGPETREARLFEAHEIPWDELAFGTVKETLERYLKHGQSGVHDFAIERRDR
ncbi:MAG: NUDIX hydrolase [Burkholderiaceae bacterium]|nr:NUDIX hydrolase [Burkholderiaceae bacterium]